MIESARAEDCPAVDQWQWMFEKMMKDPTCPINSVAKRGIPANMAASEKGHQ
jgi:hypothetical protein